MNIAFEQSDWDRIRGDYAAWWAGELDRPLVLLEGSSPPPAGVSLPHAPHFTAQLPASMPAEEVVDRYAAHLECGRWYGDAFPRWWVNFGPGIMAGFLGARVGVDDHTVWFEPDTPRELADIRPVLDESNPWWLRVRELTRVAAERWKAQACVGYTDIGGNLDILASLRTTANLLTDVLDAPEEVARLAADVTRLWLRAFKELHELSGATGRGHSPWAPIWSEGSCYMLQSDFAYMISPTMFERFVVPDLVACCDEIDHGFYHLDGKGQLPHLDMLLDIPRLRGIQWIPGDGPVPDSADWPEVLSRIRARGKLCQLFTSPAGARRIVREHGGKGFLLQVGGNWTRESAADFLAVLQSEDRGRAF
jgi:5-methyltetrahydrofolate--homocysteine methyltransferase